MSILSHILTSHIVQSEGCHIYRNSFNPVTPAPARYAVGGACETLAIAPDVHGASNIFRIVDRWLSYNEEDKAPVVGVRIDPDTHYLHVDLCTLTPLKSVALLWAKERGESVIWDLVDNVAIPVYSGLTWRELAAKISLLPDGLLDSPALVCDSQNFHRVESITPYDSDEPVSLTNPPSIDLREE